MLGTDNLVQFFTKVSEDDCCSRCENGASRKITGGRNCYYCGNEIKFCKACFGLFLDEIDEIFLEK